ncbi:GGDEF domain-containing protein [Alteromonas sp. 14N.309.X.WAT.G.H12]|uniref:GGDEF domain-containing protein n=1 Tax=Alteromonas sp. 14N.309.X.WAT.G.H12 TaxID=3120824 RepID=UPI002FCF7216
MDTQHTSASTMRQNWLNAQTAMLTSLSAVHPECRQFIESLKKRIANRDISDDAVTQEMNRLGRYLIQEKDLRSREYRIAAAEIKSILNKITASKHLSVEQRKQLDALDVDKCSSPTEALSSLGLLCRCFADESIKFRESSAVVVGETHKHIQQQSGNIIAGDISWSSKKIIKSLIPLLKRINLTYPGRGIIEANLQKATALNQMSNVDFFEALDVMESTTREVTIIQGLREQAEAEYLKRFHLHLKNIHSSLKSTLLGNTTFTEKTNGETKGFLEMLDHFKDASDAETDPEKLKKLVSHNLESLNLNFTKIISSHEAHIRQQQRALSSLESEVRTQSQRYAASLEEQKKLTKLVESATALAMTDQLTEIPNRFSYTQSMKILEPQLSQLDDKELERFGLCVIDIDHFKNINDTYGHAAGDKILKNVAELLKQLIKGAHLQQKVELYRYGGEEFVLTYKNMPLKEMAKFAELARKKMVTTPFFVSEKKTIKVTFSAGLASFTQNDKRGVHVFQLADKAMYEAKRSGRDKVLLFQRGKLKYLKGAIPITSKGGEGARRTA